MNSVKVLYQDWASLKQVTSFADFSRNVNLWPRYETSWRVEALGTPKLLQLFIYYYYYDMMATNQCWIVNYNHNYN